MFELSMIAALHIAFENLQVVYFFFFLHLELIILTFFCCHFNGGTIHHPTNLVMWGACEEPC